MHLLVGGAPQAVEKVKIRQIWYKSLAEFRRPQTTESSLFLRRHAPQKNRCSGRKCTSAVSAMQRPAAIEKILAFLIEPVDFVDRLKRTAPRLLRAGALCVGNRGRERKNRRSALFRSKEVCVPGQGREAPTDWPKR